MTKYVTELSSGTSSESYSSDESILEEDQNPVSIFDLISWNSQEGYLSKFIDTFKQFSIENKLFVLKSRCLSVNCTCNFKNYDLLLSRVFVGLKALEGKWCKLRFSKGTLPDTDTIATLIFFKDFEGWYEVLNENLEVIPFWSNVNQIVQNKPKSFILRKDSKGLYVKEFSEDSNGSITFDNIALKAGTILSFDKCRKYSMKRGRRVKEQYLAKCKDSKNNCFYFIPDDILYSSPIAGFDNISGAHSFQSIIEKFHFPINIKPIFMVPPNPNLPCSDRHFLQLTKRFQLDLIAVSPLKDSSRLFLLTPNHFNDHVFTIGEFLPPSISKHALPVKVVQDINSYRTKVDSFFAKCHKFDNLNYLLKHAEDISKTSPKFEVSDSDFDEIYGEVEGIYFFIRNGFFPRNSVQGRKKADEVLKVKTEVVVPESQHIPESSSDDQSSSDEESTDISSTSTDTDKTPSSAVEMCKKGRVKQAKSMPLGKSRNRVTNSHSMASNCRARIDFSMNDVGNMSVTGVSVTGQSRSDRKVTEVPRFYQNQALISHKFKETEVDVTLLKDTMV